MVLLGSFCRDSLKGGRLLALVCLSCSPGHGGAVRLPGPGGPAGPARFGEWPGMSGSEFYSFPGPKPSWGPASESARPTSSPWECLLGTELQAPRGMDVTPRSQSPPSPRVQTAVPSFFFISQFSSSFFCLFLTSCYEILQTYRPRKNCTLDTPVPTAPFSHHHRPRVLYYVCPSPRCSVRPTLGCIFKSFPVHLFFGIVH